MMLAVVTVEHVLSNGGDLRTIASYRGAKVFYDALSSQYNMIAFSAASDEIANWWLKRERMGKWARVYAANAVESGMTSMEWQDWKYQHIRGFLAEGWEVAFYVDRSASGAPIERVHALGVTTFDFNHSLINPGWRDPETDAPRPWEEVAVASDIGGDSHGLR
jgi:hypothetical protein